MSRSRYAHLGSVRAPLLGLLEETLDDVLVHRRRQRQRQRDAQRDNEPRKRQETRRQSEQLNYRRKAARKNVLGMGVEEASGVLR